MISWLVRSRKANVKFLHEGERGEQWTRGILRVFGPLILYIITSKSLGVWFFLLFFPSLGRILPIKFSWGWLIWLDRSLWPKILSYFSCTLKKMKRKNKKGIPSSFWSKPVIELFNLIFLHVAKMFHMVN